MTTELEYFPTVSQVPSLVFGDKPYEIQRIEGFATLPVQPTTAKGPFQAGVTLLDNRLSSRSMTITLVVASQDRATYWSRREALVQAFALLPNFDQSLANAGLLRIRRDGQTELEIDCVPVDSPVIEDMTNKVFRATIDLFAPSPFWKETDDMVIQMSVSGGIEIPETTGIEIPETTGIEIPIELAEININNQGHTSAPLSIHINGEVDTPRLTLKETGESLEINAIVASGETIRINTAYGQKEVTLIGSGGSESNAFDLLTPSRSDFFHLRPGNNTVSFTFANNPSGNAVLRWREHFTGV